MALIHLPSVFVRPDVPFYFYSENDTVHISAIKDVNKSGGIKPGDILISFGGEHPDGYEILEFLIDKKKVGDEVPVTYARSGTMRESSVTLLELYPSKRFIFVQVFVSILVWLTAIYLLFKSRYNYAAAYVHWMFVAFAVTNLIAWGAISYHPEFELLMRSIFFFTYSLVTVFFILFTFQYPHQVDKPVRLKLRLLTAPNILLAIPIIYYHASAIRTGSLEMYARFQFYFDIFRFLMVIYFVAGMVLIIRSYLKAELREERERLQWIFWGLCIGALPFLLFYILPQLIFSRYFISEEITIIFFLAVPFSFLIAMFRYKIYDIELLLNRSIVYGFVVVVLLGGYILIVLLTASEIKGEEVFFRDFNVVFITLVIAFSFNLVRKKLQDIIDKKLFSATVNYKNAVLLLSESLAKATNDKALIDAGIEFISANLHVKRIETYLNKEGRFFLYGYYDREAVRPVEHSSEKFEIKANSPAPGNTISPYIPPADITPPALEKNEADHLCVNRVCVHPQSLRLKKVKENSVINKWLERNNLQAVVAFTGQDSSLLGITLFTLSENESFNEDEFSLLTTLQTELSTALDKFRLYESFILAGEENRRLEEMNKLKSYFVSSVSHDLKTPITSIRMFAEIMQMNPDLPKEKVMDYMRTIEEESARLTRLINNLLDFAKIEKGTKEYNFTSVNLNELVKEVMKLMEYQLISSKFETRIKLPDEEFIIKGDRDSIVEALINLINNAIKFSKDRREITAQVMKRDNYAVISISDKGLGIKPENIKNIFEPFFREKTKEKNSVGGAGLGLSIVQHIMDAHNGKIDVITNSGEGTMFMLLFPVNGNETDTDS